MECGEDDFTEILERNRVIIAQKLEVDRSFLFDYLRNKSVFDSEDCEFVHAEKTREQRVGKFLDILSRKGRDAYVHFIDAVQLLNPSLYETLTGQKATARLNPIVTEGRDILGGNGALDLDIITSHLKRTMQDLQEMTLRYNQVLKDNQELNKNLKRTEADLEVKQTRVEELERQRDNSDELLSKAHGKAHRAGQGAVNQVNSLHRDLNERNTYIIALQMKLLASQEGIDSLREQLGEVTAQRDELLPKLKSISRDYDYQRRESIKLSAKLAIQTDDIHKAGEMKMRIRELQFASQKYMAERDEALKELNLLKDWTEALKARYDIVEEERRQTQQSHETVVADCSDLRDHTNELEIKLMIAKREIRDSSKRNTDLEKSSNTYRDQRDFYASARKEAIEERDQARRERDEAIQRHTAVLNTRDQIIDQQMECSKHFEIQYESLLAELRTAREQLAKTELEVEELKRVELDRAVSNASDSIVFMKPDRPTVHLPDPTITGSNKEAAPLRNMSPSSSSQSSEDSFDWKSHRKTKEIIDSLKKRVKSDRRNTSPSSSGSETLEPQLSTSSSLDEKLEELFPPMKRLSPMAKQCVSLDRTNKIHIKSFGTLECMFQGSVGSSCSLSRIELPCHPLPTGSSQTSDVSVPSLTDESFKSDGFESPPETGHNAASKIDRSSSEERRRRSPATKPTYRKSASSPSSVTCFIQPEKTGEASDKKAPSHGCVETMPDGNIVGNQDRRSLKNVSNSSAYAIAQSSICAFEYPSLEEDNAIHEALQSPTLRKPFRQRSGAKKFSEDERPRSSSAPSSRRTSELSSDANSNENSDSLSSQPNGGEQRFLFEPESGSDSARKEHSDQSLSIQPYSSYDRSSVDSEPAESGSDPAHKENSDQSSSSQPNRSYDRSFIELESGSDPAHKENSDQSSSSQPNRSYDRSFIELESGSNPAHKENSDQSSSSQPNRSDNRSFIESESGSNPARKENSDQSLSSKPTNRSDDRSFIESESGSSLTHS